MTDLKKSDVGAEERAAIFHETFDWEIDAGATLSQLVRHAGDYLARIVGPAHADAGMAKIVSPLGGTETNRDDWRAALEDGESGGFSEWPLGARLHDLAAYAYYGIALTSEEDPAARDRWLAEIVQEAVEFRDQSPLALWLGDDRAPQLETVIMLAEARWALDRSEPIDPVALARFGGISEGRIRNMMSGSGRVFAPDENKKILAHEALAWLAGRDSFWPSIWRDQRLPPSDIPQGQPMEEPVFVPVARDGSVFHAGLRRNGTYTIGEKSNERHIPDFNEALAELQKMPTPRWRRPNEVGSWGLVAGVRWERLDQADLDNFAVHPKWRLPIA